MHRKCSPITHSEDTILSHLDPHESLMSSEMNRH